MHDKHIYGEDHLKTRARGLRIACVLHTGTCIQVSVHVNKIESRKFNRCW